MTMRFCDHAVCHGCPGYYMGDCGECDVPRKAERMREAEEDAADAAVDAYFEDRDGEEER